MPFFSEKSGIIQVEVTDTKYRKSDLPNGGLEIPALLVSFGKGSDIKKLYL